MTTDNSVIASRKGLTAAAYPSPVVGVRGQSEAAGGTNASRDSTRAERPDWVTVLEALYPRWRALGFGISLWSDSGVLLSLDADGPQLWRLLFATPNKLKQHVGETLRQFTPASGVNKGHEIIDLQSGIGAIQISGLPLLLGSRVIGWCVAGVADRQCGDTEDCARWCDRFQLDQLVVANAMAAGPACPPDVRGAAIELLAEGISNKLTLRNQELELAGLAGHLGTAYEELNLICRLGSEMSFSRALVDVLADVAEHTLVSSRAACVAFLLKDGNSPEEREDKMTTPIACLEPVWDAPNARMASRSGSLKCVGLHGTNKPSIPTLERIAECLCNERENGRDFVIANNVGGRPEFANLNPSFRHCVVFIMQSGAGPIGVFMAIDCTDGGDFSTTDVNLLHAVADRVAAYLMNQRLYAGASELLYGFLHAMVSSIDAKDPYTCGHSSRVAHMSRMLAEGLGWAGPQCHRAYLAGLLHDVGKIGVSDVILCKPGKLSTEEFAALRKHPEIGARIMARIPQLETLRPAILHHHERMDGNGYPHGLKGEAIPVVARMICLVDALDAMTTTRTYRPLLTADVAIEEIRRCSGTQFDSALVKKLLELEVPKVLTQAHLFAGTHLDEGGHTESVGDPDWSARLVEYSKELVGSAVNTW